MPIEDVVRLLDLISEHAFCEQTNRDFQYCQEVDCTECSIDFCRQALKDGYVPIWED